ncbi:uncharacterized protein LOC101850817 isoform X2 [Aplysia californica]|nr:uncharacterized protein LOC101850817 isoform X2 [Aplysia californica]
MDNTEALFTEYDTVQGASVNAVMDALQKMNRFDCVEILENAKKDIRESRKRGRIQRADPSVLTSGHWGEGGPLSCTSCTSCPLANHNSHLAACGPAHVHMCNARNMSAIPHAHCDLHNGSQHRAGYPVLSGLSRCSMPQPQHYNSTQHHLQDPCCQHTERVENMASMMAEYNQYSYLASINNNNNGNYLSIGDGHPPLSQTGLSEGLRSPMLSGHNMEPMDCSNLNSNSHSNSHSNNPMVAAAAAARQRQKMSRQVSEECNIHPNCSGDKRLRADNGYACTSLSRPGQHLYPHPGTHPSQKSSWSPTGTSALPPHNSAGNMRSWPSSNTPPSKEGVAAQQQHRRHHHHNNYHSQPAQGKLTNAVVSGSHPSTGGVGNSLQYLEQLSAVPDRLKPTQEYKTFIAEQKIESEKGGRQVASDGDSYVSRTSSGSGGSYSGHRAEAATYPRGTKPRPPAGGIELTASAMGKLEISKKSTSVPKDLKANAFRRAHRDIKVFVTFSNESSAHRGEVLSLCNFLDDNQFACCVDVGVVEETPEFTEWFRTRFYEADFILACITPAYLRDISHHQDNSEARLQAGRKRLHSLEIYQLMSAEFLNNQASDSVHASRFVPLVFEPCVACALPPCLQQSQTYRWPHEYMDLVWMLSKPKERSRISRPPDNGERG